MSASRPARRVLATGRAGSTSRAAVPALVAAFALAACGGDRGADATDDGGPPASSVAPASATAAVDGLPEDWPALLDDLRCEDTTAGTFPREVEHDGGTATIETEPRRVVSIEGTTSLDLLLLMGVTPAAAGGDFDGPAVSTVQAHLAGGTPEDPGFELFAKRPEVNVEALAAARPDLVVSQSGWLEGIEDDIERLGVPVVVFDWSDDGEPPDWRNNVRIVAEAVGRDGCAEEIVARVEDAVAGTRMALVESGAADRTWSAFTAVHGYTAYHGAADPIGQTLGDELGLDLVPPDGAQTEFGVETATEVLAGDELLALDFDQAADDGLDDFLAEPAVAPVAERVWVMPPEVTQAAYYPSALGVRLFVHEMQRRYG
ncbi:MAG: ABC transporter substrate-binding protein [Actinomycetales bacterium]